MSGKLLLLADLDRVVHAAAKLVRQQIDKSGNYKVKLLKNRRTLLAVDRDNNTALMKATFERQWRLVEKILQYNLCDPNAANIYDVTLSSIVAKTTPWVDGLLQTYTAKIQRQEKILLVSQQPQKRDMQEDTIYLVVTSKNGKIQSLINCFFIIQGIMMRTRLDQQNLTNSCQRWVEATSRVFMFNHAEPVIMETADRLYGDAQELLGEIIPSSSRFESIAPAIRVGKFANKNSNNGDNHEFKPNQETFGYTGN